MERHFKQLIVVLLLSKGHFYQDNLTSIIDLASYTISVSGKNVFKTNFLTADGLGITTKITQG